MIVLEAKQNEWDQEIDSDIFLIEFEKVDIKKVQMKLYQIMPVMIFYMLQSPEIQLNSVNHFICFVVKGF